MGKGSKRREPQDYKIFAENWDKVFKKQRKSGFAGHLPVTEENTKGMTLADDED